MKFRIFSTLLILVLFFGMMPVSPTIPTTSASTTNATAMQPAALPTRDVNVAILYDPDSSDATYASAGNYWTNFTGVMNVLTSAGYHVTNISRANLVAHELQLVNYDVLVLPDIVPEDDLLPAIQEFWLGGGGILSIDGSINVLTYTGMLPAASAGDNGYGTYWQYGSTELMDVQDIAPPTRSYSTSQSVNVTYPGDAYFDWTALTSQVSSFLMKRLLVNEGDPLKVGGLGYDPMDRGGRIVQIVGRVYDIADELQQLYIDAIDWLCPRPRARIAFDLSHQPYYGVDDWDNLTHISDSYGDIRDSLVLRDYTFDKIYPSSTGNLTTSRLDNYDMLIINLPRFNFTSAEVTAIQGWIDAGGSLLALGDRPSGSLIQPNEQINRIVSSMGMAINDSALLISLTAEPLAHPTTEDCTGLSVIAPGAVNITTSSPIALWAKFGNIIAAAATHGSGRVVLVSDINWLEDSNLGDASNRQFGINVANWLTSFDASVVLYSTDGSAPCFEISSAALALNELNMKYFLVHSLYNLDEALNAMSRSLLIIDQPNSLAGNATQREQTYDSIDEYVASGGLLLMTTYQIDDYSTHRLWSSLGVAYSQTVSSEPTLYMWDATHPIFNTPLDFGVTQFDSNSGYIDDGDTVHVFDNATGLAGRTSLSQENESFIVVRNDGQTLLNSLIIDVLKDNDNSGYADSFELYLNEIAFMLRPSLNSPADVSYTAGTTGHSITWSAQSHAPASYSITRNGTGIVNGTWSGGDITVDIDGLAAGTYVYVITVTDAYGETATDTVVVKVTSGGITLPTNYLLYILIGVALLVVIVIVVKKRR
ncbi:MAG: hypothetical protein ACTSYL_07615 [Candidatus Thorarchaeota archaeon]